MIQFSPLLSIKDVTAEVTRDFVKGQKKNVQKKHAILLSFVHSIFKGISLNKPKQT